MRSRPHSSVLPVFAGALLGLAVAAGTETPTWVLAQSQSFTLLNVTPNGPYTPNQNVTLAATVYGNGTPTGYVTFLHFSDNSTLPGCVDIALDPSGIATCPYTVADTGGNYSVYSFYPGNGIFDYNYSDPLNLEVLDGACTANPVVLNGNDSGAGSLRDAIADACETPGDNTITFDPSVSSISLTSSLTVDKTLIIDGPAADALTIGGNGTFGLIRVSNGNTLTVREMRLTGGWASGNSSDVLGGAIFADGASLVIEQSRVDGNEASYGGGIAIQATGGLQNVSLTVADSLFFGNAAFARGGALFAQEIAGAAISVNVTNTTISVNQANSFGGGVHVDGASLTLTHTTITRNHSNADDALGFDDTGGGISVAVGSNAELGLRNTIVADNFFGSGSTAHNDIAGVVASSHFSLIGVDTSMSGVTHGIAGNLVGTEASPIDPKLEIINDNGGPTLSHMPGTGSPAIDAGDNTWAGVYVHDQRGPDYARILDGADADTTATVDMGAVEADPTIEDIQNQTTGISTPLTFPFHVGNTSFPFTSFTTTSSNTLLLPNVNINVSPSGSPGIYEMFLQPATGSSGSSTVTVTGYKTIGGTQLSAFDSFMLTVTNSSVVGPSLDIINNPAPVDEDSALQSVPLTSISGGTGTVQSVTAQTDNPALIPTLSVNYPGSASGTVLYTLAPNAFGSAQITVTVTSTTGTATQTFLVIVSPVNDPPTLDAIANPPAILKNAGLQTVNLTGISAGGGESQPLSVSASSDNTGVIPNPAVSYATPNATGSVSYTPVANATGSATVTVTVTDSGNASNSTSRTFLVLVNDTANPATLDAISSPPPILEDAGQQTINLTGIGGTGTLTVTALSNNTSVIPHPSITYTSPNNTGSLSYTPVANANGSATITVTVTAGSGNGSTSISRAFTAAVTPVNDAPIAQPIPNLTVPLGNFTPLVSVSIADIDNLVDSLIVTATSSNQALLPNGGIAVGGAGGARTLQLTPVPGQTGSTVISVSVSDGVAPAMDRILAASQVTFTYTITNISPSEPANLTATADGSLVLLAWNAPATGPAPTGYTVEYGTSPGSPTLSVTTGSATPSFSLPSLAPATWFFRVRATNDVGSSAPSNEATATTTAVPSRPRNLSFTIAGTSATFTWQAPLSGDATGYELRAGVSPGGTTITVPVGALPTFVVPAMPAGTFYVRVHALNGAGASGASNEVTVIYPPPVIPPSPPQNLTFSLLGSTVGLAWQAPATGSAVTTYLLDAGTAPGSSNVVLGAPVGPGLAYTQPGVPDGTYYVRVRAQNGGGTSTPSNEVTIVVGTPVIAPGPPTGLSFTTGPGGAVTLTWVAPGTGSPPTNYRIEAGSGSGLSNLATLIVGPAPTFSTTGVPPGAYFVRVRAINSAGTSGPSNEVVVVVP